MRFVSEDGTTEEISMTPGSALTAEQIPALPEKDGYIAAWEGLEDMDLEHISFDATIYRSYINKSATLRGEATRSNGLPILLAEGSFTPDQTITLTEAASTPTLEKGERLLEGHSFKISDGYATALHYLPGGTYDLEQIKVLVHSSKGHWQEVSCHVDGSYLVFEVFEDADIFCLVQKAREINPLLLAGCGGAVLILLVVWIAVKCKRKKRSK